MPKNPSRSPSPVALPAFHKKANSMLQRVLNDPDKEISINDEIAKGAKWVIDGKLRRVPPYHFTYLTFCKQRWRGRTLIDVFSKEFRDKDEAYYLKAIQSGMVYVNNEPVSEKYMLKDGDLISHRTHKHEQPVTSRHIRIVHEDDDLVVIDKPSGIPVHPTGRFTFNTVVKVLKHEHNLECHPCNRLDRLTSGLMFLAKNPKSAEQIGKQIRERQVQKEYLAKVKGEFPLGKQECAEPVRTVDPKVSLNMVDHSPEAKMATTFFQRISFDGENSIVKCWPQSGRTHQIRVHLQWLGHPIANDPIYSNPDIWGASLGSHGTKLSPKEISQRLDKIGKDTSARSWISSEKGEMLNGKHCDVCQTPLYTDPAANDLDLWLHAQRYAASDGSWSFETPVPTWVLEEHLPFMKMALEEARKCEPIESAFCVGAVLVKDGKVLETGYTRELEGNTHAEQNALTKYTQKHGELPKGTVIYTTMEPCSLRLSGNEPCATRILKTSIRTVFVGVVEPKTFVSDNTGQKQLEEAGVQFIHLTGLEAECLSVATRYHKLDSDNN